MSQSPQREQPQRRKDFEDTSISLYHGRETPRSRPLVLGLEPVVDVCPSGKLLGVGRAGRR